MVISEIHRPSTMAELLSLLEAMPEALPFAGGTEIVGSQAGRFLAFPAELVAIGGVSELRQVTLSERFVEIGAAVTLAELLELKESAVPELLVRAARGVANPAVRNLATVGGNLATRSRFMDLWPALACLDALVELRSGTTARWLNVNRLADEAGDPAFPRGQLLSRVRVPLEAWELTELVKVGPRETCSRETAVFAVAARADKGILSEFRVAFAGERALRLRDTEARIVGRRLPLDARDLARFSAEYRAAAAPLPPAMAIRFGALVEGALGLLARRE